MGPVAIIEIRVIRATSAVGAASAPVALALTASRFQRLLFGT